MDMSSKINENRSPFRWKRTYWLILLVGLIHGIFYVFFVPAWEHYDEPGHFEYSWLAANRPEWPQIGQYDNKMRYEVGKTLLANDFFIKRDFKPQKQFINLDNPKKEIWIGYSQTGDLPLYYFLTSIPLRLIKQAPITNQLYATRIVSLIFYLITIWAGMMLAAEIASPESQVRWMLPMFLATLPGLAEFMTATNNHTLAIGLMSLWIWIATRLIRLGFRWIELLLLFLLTGLCLLTQMITWITLLILPIVLLLTFIRKRRWLLVPILSALGIVAGIAIFDFNYPGQWILNNYQNLPARSNQSKVPFTQFALQYQTYPDKMWGGENPLWHPGVFQVLPIELSQALQGKNITVGAWMWADRPVKIYGPGINFLYNNVDYWIGFPMVTIGPEPSFVAMRIKTPDIPGRLQLWLRATSPDEPTTTIYSTGVVIAEGRYPVRGEPKFITTDGSKGEWGGVTFNNLARNPFFTIKWPTFRPWVSFIQNQSFFSVNPTSLPSLLSAVLDIHSTDWFIQRGAVNLFRTFWAKFSWGQVPLTHIPGIIYHPYRLLLIITFIGIVGFVLFIIRHRDQILWTEIFFLVMFTMAIIMITLSYSLLTMGGALRFRGYLPSARYIYPAILPIAYMLVTGWLFWRGFIPKRIISERFAGLIFISFMLLLGVYAIYSQMIYHSGLT